MRYSETWHLGWEQGETASCTVKGVSMDMSLRLEIGGYHAL